MNRISGIKLLAALASMCLVTATVADASVLEFKLLFNGVDSATFSGPAGTYPLAIQVRVLDNKLPFGDPDNDYIGGVINYSFNLIDSTGITTSSILEAPQNWVATPPPAHWDGKWNAASSTGFVRTKGKANATSATGDDAGTKYDVMGETGAIPVDMAGEYYATYGGAVFAHDDGRTAGDWATVVTGNFQYRGGLGTLTLTAVKTAQVIYTYLPATLANPTSVVGDSIAFGEVTNNAPEVSIPGGDVDEEDWSKEPGWNNLEHTVVITAVGVDDDKPMPPGALSYEWIMSKPGADSVTLDEHGHVLTLKLDDIKSLVLPDYPGEIWNLSVTAFDGEKYSVPAGIGVFVPEPATIGLLSFGIVGALLRRRRRA